MTAFVQAAYALKTTALTNASATTPHDCDHTAGVCSRESCPALRCVVMCERGLVILLILANIRSDERALLSERPSMSRIRNRSRAIDQKGPKEALGV